ncbi:MAG: methyltransferase domain-containing protein [bacterium]
MSSQQLVEQLITKGILKSPRIIKSFKNIDRADFVPTNLKGQAYINAPLPLGHSQTISQPLTVAFMLELLQPAPGEKILDIGSGSGWQTALLAHIVGPQGKIYGLELVLELHRQSITNISKYNFIKKGIVQMQCQSAADGLPAQGPFDKIIAAAALKEVSSAWLDQLKTNGRLVAPVGHSLVLIIKEKDGFTKEEFPGFVFVPFIP